MIEELVRRREGARARAFATEALAGLFIVSGSDLVAEACSVAGPDFLVFDMEASPVDRRLLTQMLQATGRNPPLAIARLAFNHPHLIESALDAGADGIIVPKVSTAAEAEAVVRAAKYPPHGGRGLNPIRCSRFFTELPDYLNRANFETLVGVQIETRAALDNLDEIAATPGIDMLFVGCGDLAAELGHIGDVEHPDVDDAITRVLTACTVHDVIPGIFAYSAPLARRYRQAGYRFISIGNDLKILLHGISQALADFRGNTTTV